MYDFVRNEDFNAKNFFALSTQPKPLFRQNQMGVSAGGPIIRISLFVFGDWEGIRNLTGNTITTSVPTAAMRAGNFSSGFNPIYDPATTTVDAAGNVSRTPFAGGIIPASRFDPAAVAVGVVLPPAHRCRHLEQLRFQHARGKRDPIRRTCDWTIT